MKLQDKTTGKIIELKLVQTNCECLIEHEVDTLFGKKISLKILNEYYEDYTQKEPLIKDEKIRKAVRAWVNANRWTDDVRLEFNDFGYHESWSLEQHTDNNEIHFSGRMPNCMHKQLYTITELCGDEE